MVAINVLFEHIGTTHRCAAYLLATAVEVGGSLVLWVPGYQQLYGEFRPQGSATSAAIRRVLWPGSSGKAGLDVELGENR